MPSSSPIHKAVARIKAVVAYAKIVRDPNQLGEVFALADSLSDVGAMHDSHTPHGVGVGPCSQLSERARIRAEDVLPQPRGPEKR